MEFGFHVCPCGNVLRIMCPALCACALLLKRTPHSYFVPKSFTVLHPAIGHLPAACSCCWSGRDRRSGSGTASSLRSASPCLGRSRCQAESLTCPALSQMTSCSIRPRSSRSRFQVDFAFPARPAARQPPTSQVQMTIRARQRVVNTLTPL